MVNVKIGNSDWFKNTLTKGFEGPDWYFKNNWEAFPVWPNQRLPASWPHRHQASHFFCLPTLVFPGVLLSPNFMSVKNGLLDLKGWIKLHIQLVALTAIFINLSVTCDNTVLKDTDCSKLWAMYFTLSTLHSSEGTVRLTEWIVKTWQDRTIGNDTVRAHGQWAKTPDCDLGTE